MSKKHIIDGYKGIMSLDLTNIDVKYHSILIEQHQEDIDLYKIEQEKLNAKDDYGNDKLKCEEYLRVSTTSTTTTTANNNNNPFKYLILRLPDVIGPRDNTDRSFNYFLWLRTHKDIGIPLHLKKKNSNFACAFTKNLPNLLSKLPTARFRSRPGW